MSESLIKCSKCSSEVGPCSECLQRKEKAMARKERWTKGKMSQMRSEVDVSSTSFNLFNYFFSNLLSDFPATTSEETIAKSRLIFAVKESCALTADQTHVKNDEDVKKASAGKTAALRSLASKKESLAQQALTIMMKDDLNSFDERRLKKQVREVYCVIKGLLQREEELANARMKVAAQEREGLKRKNPVSNTGEGQPRKKARFVRFEDNVSSDDEDSKKGEEGDGGSNDEANSSSATHDCLGDQGQGRDDPQVQEETEDKDEGEQEEREEQAMREREQAAEPANDLQLQQEKENSERDVAKQSEKERESSDDESDSESESSTGSSSSSSCGSSSDSE